MQAAFYERTGPAQEVLQWGSLPTPEPGPGEVRVRLRWSGVNPSDVKSRAGLRSKVLAYPLIVPHSDGMGVVDAVGAGVPAARIGQRVWIWNAAWGRALGTAAQFVVLPAEQAVALPDGTSEEAGACLGIPALTALHAVIMAGGVQAKRVLVAGGAGAVGHYAVQFARMLGARQVVATVSGAQKAELALAAGADVAVDRQLPDLATRLRQASDGEGFDRIIEVDMAANGELDAGLVRAGGEVVFYGSGAGAFSLPFFPLIVGNISLHGFIVYNLNAADRHRAVTLLTTLLERGGVQHQIAARLPLSDIAAAHALVESGRAVGNVVLAVP